MNIYFYSEEIETLIQSLEAQTIAKVLRTLDLLERFGQDLRMPHSKKIHKGLFELRIHGKQELRLFYIFHKDHIVMLHGFIKKSQETPRKEIVRAESLRKNLK